MSKHQTSATVGEPSDFSGLNHLDCGRPLDFGVTIGLLSHVVSHIHAKLKPVFLLLRRKFTGF